MNTSSLLIAFGPPLTFEAPVPKLIISDEFNGDNSADNLFLPNSQSSTVPSKKTFAPPPPPPPNKKFTDLPLVALCFKWFAKAVSNSVKEWAPNEQTKLTKIYSSAETKRNHSLHLCTVHNKISNTNVSLSYNFSPFTLPSPLPFLFWRSRDERQAGNAFRSHLLD